ncbi:MAG TPA: hypothetical protein PK536_00530 [Ignavibacteria bacterium]|nr:hypothetical protein [Bacteroidota bacterium]HRI83910.1 hypothetical protein [Ignavibacteria bacterium]HRJ98493.1 hypothetical protein [Ignavibacteria bacterium]
MKKKVLTVFDDPGGGLAVTAAAEELRKNTETELTVYSGKLSKEIAEGAGFKYKEIESMISKETAEEIFRDTTPDLLLTGTGGGNAEQQFRNLAYRENTPSVVILDYWKDYKRRWLYSDHETGKIKDNICVMDDYTKQEMTEEGFPENKIYVTGHPYLDKIFNKGRKEFNQNAGDNLNILFLSQPLEIIGIKNYDIHPLKVLSESISEYSENSGRKVSLTVRLHPSENISGEISEVLNNHGNENYDIRLSESGDRMSGLLSESDIVFGYNSIALFEARAENIKTFSLNLFPIKDSLRNAFETAGIKPTEASKTEIINALNSGSVLMPEGNVFGGGINNCLNVITDCLYLSRH